MSYIYIGFENFSGACGFVSNNIFKVLINFLCFLKTSYPNTISIFGFIVFFCILFQCLSGLIIALSLIADPMIIPVSSDEEDIDDLYTDDFFFLHESGVDFIFIFIFIHLFRNLYLNSYSNEQELAWNNGIFLFLLFHGTVFFGLVLCCTHLSDITLTIAANIINTLTFNYGNLHWFLFTDQTLNSDTIISCMYIHYILGFVCLLVGYVHSNIMHYDYNDQNEYTGIDIEIDWFKNIAIFELDSFINILIVFYVFSNFFYYFNIEALSYEIFMWGDVGFVSDVSFLGVAPHWYFSSYMGWLLLCPHHYIGIFGLLFLFVVFYFQVNIKGLSTFNYSFYNSLIFFNDISILMNSMFFIFLFCFFYTFSMLPYGSFYNAIGGNIGLLFSYLYIFFFLSVNVNSLLLNIVNNSYVNALQFSYIEFSNFVPNFILNLWIVKQLCVYINSVLRCISTSFNYIYNIYISINSNINNNIIAFINVQLILLNSLNLSIVRFFYIMSVAIIMNIVNFGYICSIYLTGILFAISFLFVFSIFIIDSYYYESAYYIIGNYSVIYSGYML